MTENEDEIWFPSLLVDFCDAVRMYGVPRVMKVMPPETMDALKKYFTQDETLLAQAEMYRWLRDHWGQLVTHAGRVGGIDVVKIEINRQFSSLSPSSVTYAIAKAMRDSK